MVRLAILAFFPPPSSLGKPIPRVIGADMQTRWQESCWSKLHTPGEPHSTATSASSSSQVGVKAPTQQIQGNQNKKQVGKKHD